MPHKFDMDAFNERMLKKLHPPARTGNLMDRLREVAKRRKPRLPKL